MWKDAPLSARLVSNSLESRAVDVWAVPLRQVSRRQFFESWMTLSIDEHGRAQRYMREADRVRFVTARACLRDILSRYLDAAPQELSFDYGPQGKPRLSGRHASTLTFNLSHDDRLAVIAVADNLELGVDIEHVVERDFDAVMSKTFTETERQGIALLPPLQRARAFYSGWTRKEAYLKAVGGGFTLGAEQVEVSMLPWEPTALIQCPIPQHVFDWSLTDLPLGPAHAGALAVAARHISVRYWRYNTGDAESPRGPASDRGWTA